MTEETVIYEQQNIKITSLRAVFAEKTYSVANITSVESKTIQPGNGLVVSLAIIGLALVSCGITNIRENLSFLIFGVFAFVLMFFVHRSSHPTYAVSLTTASGEVRAYESNDQATIKTIVESLNTAIIQKG